MCQVQKYKIHLNDLSITGYILKLYVFLERNDYLINKIATLLFVVFSKNW